ncbi:MFS transporter [Chelatococcus reniformis]|uniref:MFS transporter n=2 Tax=Chelatococcus reniformis TaxID=1494448 RepID=A0A916U168_9HYPH|nr:MFS transporter [Chelatococcus reniformis]
MLADKHGARPVIMAGVALLVAGLLVVARAESLSAVYLGFGIVFGAGVGFSYVPAIGAVQRWFVLKRGLASGIAATGPALGSLVHPKIAEALIEDLGWRGAYLTLALATGAIGLVAACFVDNSPEKRGFLPDGGDAGLSRASHAELPGWTIRNALLSRPFFVLYVATVLICLGLFVPFVHLANSAQDIGFDRSAALTLVSLIGVGSIVGRFFIGSIADRMGRKRGQAIMFSGIGVMLIWWIFANSFYELSFFALMFGAFFGGYIALSASLLVDYFGPRNSSAIIGLSYTGAGIGSLLGPPLAGYAFDTTGSYTLPIVVAALCALTASGLLMTLPNPSGVAGAR